MTKPARDANPRWPGFLLAALVAVLVTLFGAGTASAATASAAQTRVGPHTLAAPFVVGPDCGIGAGQRLGNDPPAYDFALATGVAAKTASGAESALSGARLGQHLGQLEKYGQAGSKELQSGRIRYYGNLSPANKPGEMVGRRLVREWDPASGAARTWHETMDGSGAVRIVRPETGGAKIHHFFDELGGYGGSW